MDEKTKQLADSLRANPSAAQAVFHSQDGRRLMEMLEKSIEEKADLKKMIEEYGAVV